MSGAGPVDAGPAERQPAVAMPGPLWAAIYLGIAAATLPAVLPVMVGVLTDKLALGLEHAGYVASANMGGIALGSLLGAALTARLSWRSVILAGATVLIGANLVTMTVSTFFAMAAIRFAAGLGEGLIAGICYAAMGRSGQATRALAFYVAGQGLTGAVGMGFMPALIEHHGWPLLFLLTSVVALPAFWLAHPIARLADVSVKATSPGDPRSGATMTQLGWAAVFALLIQFVGMSAIWAFLERLGHAKGLDPTHLSLALSASAIANMAGSLAVALFPQWIGGLRGLAGAFVLFLASIACAFISVDWQIYLLGAVLFMLSWAVFFPLQFGVLAAFDGAGRLAAIMPAVTGLGFTIGPALGGLSMAKGGSGAILGLGLGCMLLSTIGAVTLQRLGDSTT